MGDREGVGGKCSRRSEVGGGARNVARIAHRLAIRDADNHAPGTIDHEQFAVQRERVAMLFRLCGGAGDIPERLRARRETGDDCRIGR